VNIVAVIPARMGSSRFPGKPLAPILGMPMIGHVYERTRRCELLDDVYVATCDAEIAAYVEGIGGKAVMTSDCHERCSDRCAEAMETIEAQTGRRVDILVMIQGDEPFVTPEAIEAAVRPMLGDESIQVVNLMSTMPTRAEHDDPNEVKVVVDLRGRALYFSREPIPSWKKGATDVPMRKQVCVIPFRRDFLSTFNALAPTPLEIIESVDMLRVLEHGYTVQMVLFEGVTVSVDTENDLRRAEELMAADALAGEYVR
jgi:3-deoxy-manno-octulosonate cytidylyltransferase (CMP-KDO synthetase)